MLFSQHQKVEIRIKRALQIEPDTAAALGKSHRQRIGVETRNLELAKVKDREDHFPTILRAHCGLDLVAETGHALLTLKLNFLARFGQSLQIKRVSFLHALHDHTGKSAHAHTKKGGASRWSPAKSRPLTVLGSIRYA
ncbi:MAG TPA: hypothetical protein H9960_06395 [Candidatus Duodenibacillus intestinigallinarum]|nr:hypothetical protein [Candidatus Duodenibacillus intestinigallinarum]